MTTIKDIAKLANVSIATVSRALNGKSNTNEDTRRRIIKIAADQDYHPSAVARSLVKKESRTFGYILSGLKKGVKHTIIQDSLIGIYEFARSVQYEILMFVVDSDLQHDKNYLEFAREHSLAGVIIQGLRSDDAYYKGILDSSIPCVLIDLPADSIRVGSVSIDNFSASREIVGYLVGKGHRNIAFVSGLEEAVVSMTRLQGYRSVLAEYGIEYRADYVVQGNFSEDETQTAMLDFIPAHPEVSAVFCASDLMAIGTLRAAQILGVRVPEQLAVVGFDDILLSKYITPALSTIHQDFTEMGFEAAKMLFNIIKGQAIPHTKNIPYRFIIRNSS